MSSAAPKVRPTLWRERSPLADPRTQLAALDAVELAEGTFHERVAAAGLGPLTATGIETLQVNLGRVCNQTCAHCHVDAHCHVLVRSARWRWPGHPSLPDSPVA